MRDGLIPPRNAPRGILPFPGVQPGNSSPVVLANLVVVFGSGGGIFVYTGTPARGNLFMVMAAMQGTDRYGNKYFAGLTIGVWDAVTGNLLQHTGIDSNAMSLANANSATTIFAEADKNLFAVYTTSGRGAGNLLASIASQAGNDGVTNQYAAGYTGPVTAFQPGTSPQAPETWHNLTPLTGFAAGGQQPRYQLMSDGTVQLAGAVNLTAAQAAGTAFFALPSGYVPASSSFWSTFNTLSGYTLGAASVKVEAGGALRINVAGSLGNAVQLDGIRYPLN